MPELIFWPLFISFFLVFVIMMAGNMRLPSPKMIKNKFFKQKCEEHDHSLP